MCATCLGAMTILFLLHYYGTIHQELLRKISGKKNMGNTKDKVLYWEDNLGPRYKFECIFKT